jgi:hypothetical protein
MMLGTEEQGYSNRVPPLLWSHTTRTRNEIKLLAIELLPKGYGREIAKSLPAVDKLNIN